MLVKTTLAQSTPEAQGIASASILAFIDGVEQAELELHSLIIVRHGKQVVSGWWSPYAAELPHMLFSLSKSFTSSAVGMAVAEGLLTVQDRVVDFFPDDLPAKISDNLAAMTVHNLLSMNTGHDTDSTPVFHNATDGNWAKAFLACPVEHAPGSHFVYNSGATYMCSAIVQKLTGQTLLQYLTPRLFEPLGIEGATWQSCPRGINIGGWGLKIKTDDIANFGQLYLQKGNWQGQQLITPEWVAAATSKQTRNDPNDNPDWEQGYGYQFWRGQHDSYRGDGAFGQFCLVLQEKDAHIAITSGVPNMQAVLNLVWEHLLPAMQESPLPANPSAQTALAQRVGELTLRHPKGAASSPTAKLVSGKNYRFEKNEDGVQSIQLDFDDKGAQLILQDDQGTHHIACGYQQWLAGESRFLNMRQLDEIQRTAASGAWTSDDTYTIRVSYNETPFIPTLTLRFVDDQLQYSRHNNVGFGGVQELERPTLTGKRG